MDDDKRDELILTTANEKKGVLQWIRKIMTS